MYQATCTWAAMHTTADPARAAVLPGTDLQISIAGPGAPSVSEFAVIEYGTAIGLSADAAVRYVAHVVETRYRLPRLHTAVTSARVPVWRARRIAEATLALPAEAAEWVDRHLAGVAATCSYATLARLVEEALCRFDPETAEDNRAKATEDRRLDIHLDAATSGGACIEGTVDVVGCLDLADALDLDNAVTREARNLALAGSDQPLDVRRSQALGILARTQTTLDLTSDTSDAAARPRRSEPSAAGARTTGRAQHPPHRHRPARHRPHHLPDGHRPVQPLGRAAPRAHRGDPQLHHHRPGRRVAPRPGHPRLLPHHHRRTRPRGPRGLRTPLPQHPSPATPSPPARSPPTTSAASPATPTYDPTPADPSTSPRRSPPPATPPPTGSPNRPDCATPAASSPTAPAEQGAAPPTRPTPTSTTSPPTTPKHPTAHPARPPPRTSPPSAGDTTAPRPTPPGPTTPPPPGSSGPAPTATSTSSNHQAPPTSTDHRDHRPGPSEPADQPHPRAQHHRDGGTGTRARFRGRWSRRSTRG